MSNIAHFCRDLWNVIAQKIKTKMHRITIKVICATLMTISAVVLAFLLLPSLWFWVCWEILAAGLVALGCCGEWYMFLNPAKKGHESHHRRKELQFITAVAIGVFMEFLALAHAIPEAIRLQNQVEALHNENLRLIKEIAPRRLTGEQKAALSKVLSNKFGAVVIVSSLMDNESADFADDLDSAIRGANWQTLRIRNHLGNRYGVFVGTFEGTELPYAIEAKRLGDALISIGISCEIRIFNQSDKTKTTPVFKPDMPYLVIEHKPPPTFNSPSK